MLNLYFQKQVASFSNAVEQDKQFLVSFRSDSQTILVYFDFYSVFITNRLLK